MATIERYTLANGKTRYLVRYRTPDKKQTKKRGFTRKIDAENYLANIQVSKLKGEYVSPSAGKVTIGELATAWLANKKALLKPSSYAPLEASWRNYVAPRWATTPVNAVQFSDVQSWVTSIDKSPTVVIRAYGILASILDTAERDGRVSSNKARGVTLPRKTKSHQRRYLTHEQLWAVAEASGEHAALVLTLGYCGLRWGEAIALRVEDLDMLRGKINVHRNAVEVHNLVHEGTPKTHEKRQVIAPRAILPYLAHQCEGKARDALVFDNGHGGFMSRVRASQGNRSWWLTALAKNGIDRLVLHDLRHTAASLAVSSGANVKAVQRMLGHSSAAMTLDVYSDLFDEDLEAVAARLDEVIAEKKCAHIVPKTSISGND